MKEIKKYANCFVCGDKNEIGLKAKFYFENNEAHTDVEADKLFEGYRGIYHGGIISTLLDEVMIKAILAGDKIAVTAEMTIKYKRPTEIGDKIRFTGRITSNKGRLYLTSGEAVNQNGDVLATATGKYLEAKPELSARLKQSL